MSTSGLGSRPAGVGQRHRLEDIVAQVRGALILAQEVGWPGTAEHARVGEVVCRGRTRIGTGDATARQVLTAASNAARDSAVQALPASP